jgi:hypothetical protein
MRWARQGRRRVEADFGGGRLSSEAGLLLLREVDRRTGLSAALAGCVGDPRQPAKIQHEQSQMFAQRIHAIAAGHEDLNDHQTLRTDPLLQLCAGVDPLTDRPLASSSTLCRLENRVRRSDCVRMHEVLIDQFIASHDRPPQQLILDFDATDNPLHGKQEGRFFHGYYDHYCYLPLYVFCGQTLLCAYLRPSNIDASRHARAILKLLVDKLRRAWPKVKIIFRGDSGFCRWRLMRWCERHGVDYILGLARNKRLEAMSEAFMQQAEADYQASQTKQRQFHRITYAANTWDRRRQVIVKAERLAEGPNLRFIVSSLAGDAQQLYDQVYCARGEMENRIKEQQLGLFADRTSCSKLLANQFRLLLSSAAYVLMQQLRQTMLIGTELAQAQVSTIRTKLIKIAARVVVSARRVVLHLSSSYPLQPLFGRLAQRLNPTAFDTS